MLSAALKFARQKGAPFVARGSRKMGMRMPFRGRTMATAAARAARYKAQHNRAKNKQTTDFKPLLAAKEAFEKFKLNTNVVLDRFDTDTVQAKDFKTVNHKQNAINDLGLQGQEKKLVNSSNRVLDGEHPSEMNWLLGKDGIMSILHKKGLLIANMIIGVRKHSNSKENRALTTKLFDIGKTNVLAGNEYVRLFMGDKKYTMMLPNGTYSKYGNLRGLVRYNVEQLGESVLLPNSDGSLSLYDKNLSLEENVDKVMNFTITSQDNFFHNWAKKVYDAAPPSENKLDYIKILEIAEEIQKDQVPKRRNGPLINDVGEIIDKDNKFGFNRALYDDLEPRVLVFPAITLWSAATGQPITSKNRPLVLRGAQLRGGGVLDEKRRKQLKKTIDELIEIYFSDTNFTYNSFFNETYKGQNPEPTDEQILKDAQYTIQLLDLSSKLDDSTQVVTDLDLFILNRYPATILANQAIKNVENGAHALKMAALPPLPNTNNSNLTNTANDNNNLPVPFPPGYAPTVNRNVAYFSVNRPNYGGARKQFKKTRKALKKKGKRYSRKR